MKLQINIPKTPNHLRNRFIYINYENGNDDMKTNRSKVLDKIGYQLNKDFKNHTETWMYAHLLNHGSRIASFLKGNRQSLADTLEFFRFRFPMSDKFVLKGIKNGESMNSIASNIYRDIGVALPLTTADNPSEILQAIKEVASALVNEIEWKKPTNPVADRYKESLSSYMIQTVLNRCDTVEYRYISTYEKPIRVWDWEVGINFNSTMYKVYHNATSASYWSDDSILTQKLSDNHVSSIEYLEQIYKDGNC
jgi:hypothetical protein